MCAKIYRICKKKYALKCAAYAGCGKNYKTKWKKNIKQTFALQKMSAAFLKFVIVCEKMWEYMHVPAYVSLETPLCAAFCKICDICWDHGLFAYG